MTDKQEKIEIRFAPGAFDEFEGTQEELDALVAEIKRMVDTGEIFENAVMLSEEDIDELPDGVKAALLACEVEDGEDSDTAFAAIEMGNKRLLN